MSAIPHFPSLSSRILPGFGIKTRACSRRVCAFGITVLKRVQRLLPLAVVLSLILQLVPLNLPPPSRVVNRLLAGAASPDRRLAVLPAWMNPGPQAVAEALAPGLGPRTAYAQATPTTLQFAKSCEPTPVNQGQLITYSLYITNTGSVTATILITDTFPRGTSYVGTAASTSGGANWGTSEFSDYVLIYTNDYYGIPGDGLPPSGAAVRRFQVRVSKPFTDGAVLTNTAVLTANIDPPELTAWCTNTVNAPHFVIAKTPSSPVVDAGGPLTFTLYVTNAGHLTATSTFTVADRIPDDTYYVASSPPSTYSLALRTITWTLDTDLGLGQAVATTFAVTVTSPYTNGAIITNATYEAASPDVIAPAVGDPVTVTVRSSPALTLTKSAFPDPVQAGAYLTYTLTLTNQSSANGHAQHVVVTDSVPARTWLQSYGALVAGTGIVSNGVAPNSVLTWTLPADYSLAAGDSTQFTFTVQVHSPEVSGTLITNASYGVTATNALAPTAGEPLTTTINSRPSLTVAKSVAPDRVLAGNSVTYTITITNEGNETATGVAITDTLPISFTFGGMVQGAAPNGSPSNVITWTNQTVTGTVVYRTITPGPLTLIFTATTDADIPNETVWYNAVTVTYNLTAVATGPTAPVTVIKPQLGVAKAAHSSVVPAGEVLTYTLTYSNASSTPASSVIITDRLPDHVSFVTTVGDFLSYEPPTPLAGQVMTYTIGDLLQSAGLQSITLVVRVTTPLTNGTVLTNEAWISAFEPSAGGSGPVTVTVQGTPDIVLTKYASHDPVTPGDTLTYTLEAVNNGNGNATGVFITDVLPAHTYFVAASGTFAPASPSAGEVMTWTVPPILGEGLETFTATLVVTIATPLTNGLQIANTAWITSAEGVGDSDTVTVTVSSTPTLALLKTDDPDGVSAGGTLSYTIIVTNLASANAPATGVVLSDTVPEYTSFIDASAICAEAGGVISCTLSDLGVGSSAAVTFTVQVDSDLANGTILTNTAAVTCVQGVTATDTETTTVLAPDPLVLKSAFPVTFVRPDDLIAYVVAFTNAGGFTASDVRITDTLPVSVSLVTSYTVGASFDSHSGPLYSWISSTVAPGGAGRITITARVTTTPGWIDPAGGTSITNSVEISATADDDTANNRDVVATAVRAGLPATLTLTAVPTTTSVDGSATIAATVTDRWGNLVSDADNVTVTLSSSLVPGSQITPQTITMVGGQGTAVITSTVTGVALVTGTVGAHPTVTGTTRVTFTAGAPAVVTLTIAPPTTVVGTSARMTATVADAYGNLSVGSLITFSTADALGIGGGIAPTSDATDANGVATSVITATASGVKLVTAVAPNGIDDTAPVTFTAGAPVTITLVADPDTVGVGVDAILTATVVDRYTNPVPGQVVTFESTNLGGGGILPASDTTGVAGQATSAISSTLLGSRLVTATAPNGITDTTWVTFTAGAPAVVTLTIAPPTTVVGTSARMTATVADAYGNLLAGSLITFSTADALGVGGGIAPTSDATDANGVATSVITSTASGVKLVTATAPNGVDGTAPVTFTAAALTHFDVGPVADPQTAGVPFTLLISARDQYSNTVVSFGGQVTMTDSTGTLSPLTSGLFVGGLRAVSVTITLAQQNVRIVVTNTAGVETGTSNAFDVIPNVPASVTLQADPLNVPLAGTAALTATATDAWSNFVADGHVVTFTAANGTVVPLTDTTLNGQALSQLTADCVERTGVAVTATVGTVSGTTTVSFTLPGAVVNMAVVAAPTIIQAGGTAVVTATLADCGGRGVPGQTVDFAASLGNILPASGTTNGDGVVTATLQGTVVGTSYITATHDGLSGTATVLVEPGLPGIVTVTANPAMIPANGTATSTITVDVTDAYGNAVVDGTEVTLDYRPTALGTLSPLNFTTSGGGGAAVFTADVVTGTVMITATAGGAVGTTPLTLTQGISYVYLPLMMRNYPVLPPYDLVVESVTWIPAPPAAGQPYHVQVVVRNNGHMAVTSDFWVDLYLRPSATPGVNQAWNTLSLAGYGKAWLVRDDIGPGQTVTLHTSDPDDPQHPVDRYSLWPPPNFDASHNPFYVLVDSWGYTYGFVDEGSAEDNNLWGPADAGRLSGSQAEQLRRSPGPAVPSIGPRPQLPVDLP